MARRSLKEVALERDTLKREVALLQRQVCPQLCSSGSPLLPASRPSPFLHKTLLHTAPTPLSP